MPFDDIEADLIPIAVPLVAARSKRAARTPGARARKPTPMSSADGDGGDDAKGTQSTDKDDSKDDSKGDGKSGSSDAKTGSSDAAKEDGKGGGKGGDNQKGGRDDEKPRSKRPLIILAIVVVVLAVVALIVWFANRNDITTDDAYTDGNTVTMAPKVAGYVVALYINDNTLVKKGDLLLRIDPRDYLAAQAQAEAQLTLARAQLDQARIAYDIAKVQYPAQFAAAKAQQRAAEASFATAQSTYLRQHSVDRRATTEETIDAANSQEVAAAANVESAKAQVAVTGVVPDELHQAQATVAEREAQVKQAEAQLVQANLNLSYTEIRAPSEGFITKRNVQLGSYLSAGTTMFLIVTPEIWITANFKESQLGRMRPGNPVDITVDAYSGLKLHGHIDSIQYGSGSRFSAFPTENATGNFVKIVQRVPVKIVIDSGLDPNTPLPLGLSVSPVVRLP
jgi:membrane fusion protein (multidrug efflux system)